MSGYKSMAGRMETLEATIDIGAINFMKHGSRWPYEAEKLCVQSKNCQISDRSSEKHKWHSCPFGSAVLISAAFVYWGILTLLKAHN
jgi:hypothetical protein